jgi:hypothetical protein
MRGQVVIGGPTPVEQGPSIDQMAAIMMGVASLTAGALAAMSLAIASRRRLPLWAHPWTASAAMGILAALSIAADDVPYLMSPLLDTVVGLSVLLLLVFAIGVAGWLDVLLGGLAGLSAAMAISLLLVFAASAAPFRRLDIAMLACALGFVFGALVARFARSRPRARWIWLAIGTLLNLGTLANIEDVVLRKWRLTHSQTGPAWILPVGMVAMMVFGPVLGLVARTFRRRRA